MVVFSRSATTTTTTTTTYTRHNLIRQTKTCVGNNNSLCYSATKKAPPQRILGGARGSRVILAASPPTEDALVATDPLTKQDLVDYLASGCKPKDKWRSFFFSFFYVSSYFSFLLFLVIIIVLTCFSFLCRFCLHDLFPWLGFLNLQDSNSLSPSLSLMANVNCYFISFC